MIHAKHLEVALSGDIMSETHGLYKADIDEARKMVQYGHWTFDYAQGWLRSLYLTRKQDIGISS